MKQNEADLNLVLLGRLTVIWMTSTFYISKKREEFPILKLQSTDHPYTYSTHTVPVPSHLMKQNVADQNLVLLARLTVIWMVSSS